MMYNICTFAPSRMEIVFIYFTKMNTTCRTFLSFFLLKEGEKIMFYLAASFLDLNVMNQHTPKHAAAGNTIIITGVLTI